MVLKDWREIIYSRRGALREIYDMIQDLYTGGFDKGSISVDALKINGEKQEIAGKLLAVGDGGQIKLSEPPTPRIESVLILIEDGNKTGEAKIDKNMSVIGFQPIEGRGYVQSIKIEDDKLIVERSASTEDFKVLVTLIPKN